MPESLFPACISYIVGEPCWRPFEGKYEKGEMISCWYLAMGSGVPSSTSAGLACGWLTWCAFSNDSSFAFLLPAWQLSKAFLDWDCLIYMNAKYIYMTRTEIWHKYGTISAFCSFSTNTVGSHSSMFTSVQSGCKLIAWFAFCGCSGSQPITCS